MIIRIQEWARALSGARVSW